VIDSDIERRFSDLRQTYARLTQTHQQLGQTLVAVSPLLRTHLSATPSWMCLKASLAYKLCTTKLGCLRRTAASDGLLSLSFRCRTTATSSFRQPTTPQRVVLQKFRSSPSAFSVAASACPLAWNSLPDYTREESVGKDESRQHLKTSLPASCIGDFCAI